MRKFKFIPDDVKTVVFDWDGTLHESMHIYKPAFLKAYRFLVEHGYAKEYEWKDHEIARFLGMNPKEMWESFTPKLPQEVMEKGSLIISQHMLELINQKKAVLYEGALEVLKTLKDAGKRLIYLSNSKIYYMEAMRRSFELDQYFDYIYCSEMFDYISKSDILSKIKMDFPSKMMMVGDRGLDIDTGIKNGAKTIGCLYGYGTEKELEKADYKINSIKDLME